MPKSKRSSKSKARAKARRNRNKKTNTYKKLKQLAPAYFGLALSQIDKKKQP